MGVHACLFCLGLLFRLLISIFKVSHYPLPVIYFSFFHIYLLKMSSNLGFPNTFRRIHIQIYIYTHAHIYLSHLGATGHFAIRVQEHRLNVACIMYTYVCLASKYMKHVKCLLFFSYRITCDMGLIYFESVFKLLLSVIISSGIRNLFPC